MTNRIVAVVMAMLVGGSAAWADEVPVDGFKISTENFMTVGVWSKTDAVDDPDVRGVTCYVTSLERTGLTMASDPSNTSIACRQTGAIYAEDIGKLEKNPQGADVLSGNKGGWGKSLFTLFKTMHLRRVYDAKRRTILYTSYVDTPLHGSYKLSTSAVALYGVTLQ